jgi:hypothetical protein
MRQAPPASTPARSAGSACARSPSTPPYVSRAWHALIDRALYLTRNWTADDERRELTGLPYEPALATKP